MSLNSKVSWHGIGEAGAMPGGFPLRAFAHFINVHMEITMNKMQQFRAIAASALLGSVASAHAALPTEASAAFTAISGNVTDVLAVVWPIVAAVTGGFVLIKLFKKGANKAV